MEENQLNRLDLCPTKELFYISRNIFLRNQSLIREIPRYELKLLSPKRSISKKENILNEKKFKDMSIDKNSYPQIDTKERRSQSSFEKFFKTSATKTLAQTERNFSQQRERILHSQLDNLDNAEKGKSQERKNIMEMLRDQNIGEQFMQTRQRFQFKKRSSKKEINGFQRYQLPNQINQNSYNFLKPESFALLNATSFIQNRPVSSIPTKINQFMRNENDILNSQREVPKISNKYIELRNLLSRSKNNFNEISHSKQNLLLMSQSIQSSIEQTNDQTSIPKKVVIIPSQLTVQQQKSSYPLLNLKGNSFSTIREENNSSISKLQNIIKQNRAQNRSISLIRKSKQSDLSIIYSQRTSIVPSLTAQLLTLEEKELQEKKVTKIVQSNTFADQEGY